MRRDSGKRWCISRREFLRRARWASPLLIPAPFAAGLRTLTDHALRMNGDFPAPTALREEQMRLIPHYPSPSPLDAMLRLVPMGSDAFAGEGVAAELQTVLRRWQDLFRAAARSVDGLAPNLADLVASNLSKSRAETSLRATPAAQRRSRTWGPTQSSQRHEFLSLLADYFSAFRSLASAELEIVHIQISENERQAATRVRYSFAGKLAAGGIEERIGEWELDWAKNVAGAWRVEKWVFGRESVTNAPAPLFADLTAAMLGNCESYQRQLLAGTDEWRSVLDGATGIDVYGNNGVAAGDYDDDGFDDIYVCQPSGLPNRLYRNRGDGTFEDVTEKAGVAVLDATSCALFADFQNRGRQDLLVVCDSGPLLFVNQGNGKFEHKPEAFTFARAPQGTFTHAAIADYDRDGKLDIYFCLYSYYLGLDQYHYPSPYFDARNGPANFLLHNNGDGTFTDRTEAVGLNAENDRYSFACAWGDLNGNGWPDLYVANDFGRSNLYRNNGDGTFAAVSDSSGANDVGAGMSACWLDAANNGKQDIYVSNMWAAAGQRVSEDEHFHQRESAEIKALYRRHARGNSFYKNLGNGRFKNASAEAGVEMGRWAWSSDSWDFDHDGFADLYVANGYISGSAPNELSSFFWRQVVGNSPASSTPFASYEQGWSAINELIRSDHTWNGYERNVLFVNNGDGTFCDISGVSGLDFLDDGRSFALADLNHDGRLEVILKSRTAPQLRILQNNIADIGDSISIRLRGTKSNRDAIGTAVTIRCGSLVQTKYLQAGTGFLSQHAKELVFGLGKLGEPISASIRWSGGQIQTFADLPRNQRITIEEGVSTFAAVPRSRPPANVGTAIPQASANLPEATGTWLIEPLPLPDFSLTDTERNSHSLSSLNGKPAVLYFWSTQSVDAATQLKAISALARQLSAKSVRLLAINLDDGAAPESVSSFAAGISVPVLQGTPDFAGAYNLIYRYLFDRRRDLPIPCTFLLNESGKLVKIYQGPADLKQLLADVTDIPSSYDARAARALPFSGKLYRGRFQRNDFTYGVALFQHGYLDAAASSFQQVIAAKPDNAEAHYNLGTLFLRKGDSTQARPSLEKAVSLRPDYPEAWNNLGMIAAQQNEPENAVQYFERALTQRPDYVTALLNLGNTLRRQGKATEASERLSRALELEPENPEANYGLGMLYARQGDSARAEVLIQKAVSLRPNYPDALNNLGVLFIRDGRNADAEKQFQSCIEAAPNFDQAYLNLAQLYAIEKQTDKARATLEALLKLQPQHKLARQALEMLH